MMITDFDVAIVDGDTHIGEWVKQHKTLQIARWLQKRFGHFVPDGGIVVDGGANIGDHTIEYAQMVGVAGTVFAFEPNPAAMECLRYNMRNYPQVRLMQAGLSDQYTTGFLSPSPNVGASHIELTGTENPVSLVCIDSLFLQKLHLLKLDIEGFETYALRGAAETINRCRPVMLLEVNTGALERAGSSEFELLQLIESFGYRYSSIDGLTGVQYDIECFPV